MASAQEITKQDTGCSLETIIGVAEKGKPINTVTDQKHVCKRKLTGTIGPSVICLECGLGQSKFHYKKGERK